MQNGILKLDWSSIADAILVAVVVAVVTGLVQLVSTGHFDVFSADWLTIGKGMVNTGFIAAVIMLGKELLTTNTGSFLGLTSGYTPTQQG